MMQTTLFAKDVNDSIRVWIITVHDNGLTIEYGMLGGSIQTKNEEIRVGKGGRTKDQQIYSRYLSRINKQYDQGYVEDLDVCIAQKRKNAIGLLRPMLASPIKNVRNIDYERAFYQHKYDGNRCLVTKQSGKIIAYSRNGKPVKSIGHILSGIEIDEGQTIDGELYCHGFSLQTICSWIKRKQEATLNLSLRVYDIVDNSPYIERLDRLESLRLGDHAEVVPTIRVESESSLDSLLESSLKDGYEGGILRWGDEGYEDGKRSKSLAKIKVCEDDEFIILDVMPSKDGWARFELEAHNGESFNVTAPGTFNQKMSIMDKAEEYIGKSVNVKYSNLTKDGIPFHPVATGFRDKNDE